MKTAVKLLTPLLILSAACSKQPAAEKNPAIERIPESITIKGCSERIWANTDVMSVFDTDLTKVNFRTSNDNVPTASFTASNWTCKAPIWAAFSPSKDTNACTEDGIFSVIIKANQAIAAPDRCSKDSEAAVGKITGSPGSYEVQMKNVSGFIRVKLNTGIVAKMKATAIGKEIMNGYIDVDYAKIEAGAKDFWKITEGKSSSKEAVATPAKDGCFPAGEWLISILPGTYSQGIKISMYNDEETEIYSTTLGEGTGIEILRNDEVTVEVTIDASAGYNGISNEGVTPGQTIGYDE